MVWILGIETSCDETAVALVDESQAIRASVVISQIADHRPFGGIVPEIAARAHDRNLLPVLEKALATAGITDPATEIAAVAVTNRPGLIGALLIGVAAAKTVAWVWQKPLIAVHHLYGHIQSARMQAIAEGNPAPERFACLVVSGGHTQIYDVLNPLEATIIGRTRDDAAGEAFDKVAALLGLDYPGGPSIQKTGATGNPKAIRFPRSLKGDGTLDFSFSGIKTAVLYYLHGQDARGPTHGKEIAPVPDICASFEQAVVDVLVAKCLDACAQIGTHTLAVVGGVAANARLRRDLTAACAGNGIRLIVPPLSLCTDNAAFIAGQAWHHLRSGDTAPITVDAFAKGET